MLIALPMADRLGESYQIDSATASAYTTGGIVSAVVGAALITTGVTLLVMGTRRTRRATLDAARPAELRF